MSAGEFKVAAVATCDLAAELARIGPRELLAPDSLLADEEFAPLLKSLGPALTPLPGSKFDSGTGERALKALYRVAALDAFGAFSRAELSAAGALVGYLELTQKGKLPALRTLARTQERAFMGIDPATRRNLELTETLSGTRAGSLLARHRSHGDGGRRAGTGGAAVVAVDGSGCDCDPAGCGGVFRRRFRSAACVARRSAPRAGYRARIGAHFRGPRRAARSGRIARRHQGGAGVARQVLACSTIR